MVTSTEMQHWSHPHKLVQETRTTAYTCDGCKEPGTGPKYRCAVCDYDLHKECALALPSARHRSFPDSVFQLLAQPPPPGSRSCDACGKLVLGFMYHCTKTGYDLHPCCLTVVPGTGVNRTRETSNVDVLSRSINTPAPAYDLNAVFTASYNQQMANIISELNKTPAHDPNSLYGASYNQAMANIISGLGGNPHGFPTPLHGANSFGGASSNQLLGGLMGGSNPYAPPQVAIPFGAAASTQLMGSLFPQSNGNSGQGVADIISAVTGDPTGGIMSLITSLAQL